MADADIYPAALGDAAPLWGRRVYYANCHREGGDYTWLRDNLATAPNAIGEHKVDYSHPLSAVQKATLLDEAGRNDATIDNDATTREISYLLHAFQTTSNLIW